MFVLGSAIRVLLPTGLPVGPGFAGGVSVASFYAAGGNNLPVAAALGASPGLGTGAGVLAAAIGPKPARDGLHRDDHLSAHRARERDRSVAAALQPRRHRDGTGAAGPGVPGSRDR